jgi:LmbE family N-acetylglucosaminyl deacetylase
LAIVTGDRSHSDRPLTNIDHTAIERQSRPIPDTAERGPDMPTKDGVAVKHIYISPHADDVALSCGGQILSGAIARTDILVLNVFISEGPLAPDQAGGNDGSFSGSISGDRDAEDFAAWESVGIETRHAWLPEALIRRQFPFALLRRKAESGLEDALHAIVASLATAHSDAVFHFPAGLGNHIDHLACRNVAFRLLDDGIVPRILLYEDVPYSWLSFVRRPYYQWLLSRIDLSPASRALACRPGGVAIGAYLRKPDTPFPRGKRLFPLVSASLSIGNALGRSRRKRYDGKIRHIALTDLDMARKRDLIFHYASQIPMLFGDEPDALLAAYRESFSSEYEIEIARKP